MADDQPPTARQLALQVNGRDVSVPDRGDSLLGVLRDELGLTGAKDGCSPQGQCGCCTVLVDGKPRVACVTPARRVVGREIVTIEGLTEDRRSAWGEALCATGGSQCGFCTPGIVLRLEAMAQAGEGLDTPAVDQALLAHLCRCTGWQTIHEAASIMTEVSGTEGLVRESPVEIVTRDHGAAGAQATIEGGGIQRVSPEVTLGLGGFAADTAPAGALRAVPDAEGGWAVGETLDEARKAAGKTQGRRTTAAHSWPLEVPEGDWDAALQTTWVEPAFLETDASWCEPGGQPSSPLANGGAFGAKQESPVAGAARQLADEHGRAVLALASREDTVRWGPKRPPLAGGAMADGTGVVVVRATDGIAEAIGAVAPDLEVREVEGIAGPPTSSLIRAAGWAEAVALLAAARGEVGEITAPNGATATADLTIEESGRPRLEISVRCGQVVDEVVLRSYCIGAAHMAYSMVCSEALTVDDAGEVHDLTIRSFGVVRAVDTPVVDVTVQPSDGALVNGSDAVFAAVCAAVWLQKEAPRQWPIGLF